MKNYHIPIFVPHKGCPHDCVFCNQRQITGQTSDVTGEDVDRIINEYLPTLDKNSYTEAAFFGGSFTGIEIEKQTELLAAAYPYVVSGEIQGIRCSTRADYISEEILDNLKRFGTTTVELGVQSTDDEVLTKSRRGHSFDDVVRASELIKSYGIKLGLQMMLGLPGDTREKMLKTARDLIELKPECVRIYPTLVVKDTALWSMYQKGTYTPLTLEETVDILSEIIPMFERENISVIRVGLQTTDNISEGNVDGPYHPAIRELACGRIIRNILEANISGDVLSVEVSPKRVSETSGHRRCNKEYFLKKYSVILDVKEDKNLTDNEIRINGKVVKITV